MRVPTKVRFKNRVPIPNAKVHSVTEFQEWNISSGGKCAREGDSFFFTWPDSDKAVEVPIGSVDYVVYRLEGDVPKKEAPKARGRATSKK